MHDKPDYHRSILWRRPGCVAPPDGLRLSLPRNRHFRRVLMRRIFSPDPALGVALTVSTALVSASGEPSFGAQEMSASSSREVASTSVSPLLSRPLIKRKHTGSHDRPYISHCLRRLGARFEGNRVALAPAGEEPLDLRGEAQRHAGTKMALFLPMQRQQPKRRIAAVVEHALMALSPCDRSHARDHSWPSSDVRLDVPLCQRTLDAAANGPLPPLPRDPRLSAIKLNPGR